MSIIAQHIAGVRGIASDASRAGGTAPVDPRHGRAQPALRGTRRGSGLRRRVGVRLRAVGAVRARRHEPRLDVGPFGDGSRAAISLCPSNRRRHRHRIRQRPQRQPRRPVLRAGISKQRTPTEIEAFVAAWDCPTPIAIVPTSYPQFDEARIADIGKIGMVIYGNHAIRASVKAMRDAFRAIAAAGGAAGVASTIASVEDIFALQEMDRITADERRFLR